jgi:hypothetical protein
MLQNRYKIIIIIIVITTWMIDDDDHDSGESCGLNNCKRKPKCMEKTSSSATLFAKNPI